MRRILRIWPLFYFCVLFGFVLFPFLKTLFGEVPSETASPVFYLFFLNNIDLIRNGVPDSSVLSVLWSIAIEEQFYLMWPLLIGWSKPRLLPYIFGLIIVCSFGFRWSYIDNGMVLEHHTISCISDLTVGGLGAYLSYYSLTFYRRIEALPRVLITSIYLMAIVLYFFRNEIFHQTSFLLALDRLAVSLVFLLIILEQNFSRKSLFKLKNLKLFTKLGQYTYGLYCLHMIGLLVTSVLVGKLNLNTTVWQVLIVEALFSLAITLGLAYVSFHFFEKKFLRWKNKFSLLTYHVNDGKIYANKQAVNVVVSKSTQNIVGKA